MAPPVVPGCTCWERVGPRAPPAPNVRNVRSRPAPLSKANYHIVVAGGTGAWLPDGVPPTSRGGMKLVPRIVRPLFWLALGTAATVLVGACGGTTPSSSGPVTFKGTKMVGYSAPLTGQSALYGHAVSQSLNLAADDINAKGGVNGYKIEMDIQDDATTVPQAVSNTKNMILQDNVVALMGSVNSAQFLSESPVAQPNKIITIDATCHSWQLTMESDVVNPYWVSIVPNTYMEGTSACRLAAGLGVNNNFLASPKYLSGI